MRGWLAVLAALLTAAPAAAQDKPAWVGLWEGHVGKLPVRLCVDAWSDGEPRGSYYYLSRLEPIALRAADDGKGWTEHAGESEARWTFTELDAQRMRGTWQQGTRSLPFDLHPASWTAGSWDGPCGSAAYLAPRVRPPEIASEAGSIDGLRFTRKTFVPAPQFRDDVTLESFAFAPTQPGDGPILTVLDGYLPHGTVEDEFVDCFAGAITSLGTDGYFERKVAPAFANDAFLTIDEANSTFCGGAHPNHWQVKRTFDRQSGEQVDLFTWLNDASSDSEDPHLPGGVRDLVLARWPTEEAECTEAVGEADIWLVGLARDGLAFEPSLPHVAGACEEFVTVEWAELAPFLSDDGRAGLARVRR